MAWDDNKQAKMIARTLGNANSTNKQENAKKETVEETNVAGKIAIPKKTKKKRNYAEATTLSFTKPVKEQLLRQAKRYGYTSRNGKPNMSGWITAISNQVEAQYQAEKEQKKQARESN